MRPMSLNAYFQARGRKRFEDRFRPWKERLTHTFGSRPKLDSNGVRLYGRVICFNRQREGNTLDVDNLFKPLFDALEGIVYENDRNIVHVEGIRLDMKNYGFLFDLAIDQTIKGIDCSPIFDEEKTSILIEIAPLSFIKTSMVAITWLA